MYHLGQLPPLPLRQVSISTVCTVQGAQNRTSSPAFCCSSPEPNISASKWSQVILILLSVNQVLGYNCRKLFKSVLKALFLCALSTPSRASVRSLVTDTFVKHVTPDRTSHSFHPFMYSLCIWGAGGQTQGPVCGPPLGADILRTGILRLRWKEHRYCLGVNEA